MFVGMGRGHQVVGHLVQLTFVVAGWKNAKRAGFTSLGGVDQFRPWSEVRVGCRSNEAIFIAA